MDGTSTAGLTAAKVNPLAKHSGQGKPKISLETAATPHASQT